MTGQVVLGQLDAGRPDGFAQRAIVGGTRGKDAAEVGELKLSHPVTTKASAEDVEQIRMFTDRQHRAVTR